MNTYGQSSAETRKAGGGGPRKGRRKESVIHGFQAEWRQQEVVTAVHGVPSEEQTLPNCLIKEVLKLHTAQSNFLVYKEIS